MNEEAPRNDSDERARLRIRLGAAEIEFEGREDFWKQEVAPTVVAKLMELVENQTELQRAHNIKVIESDPQVDSAQVSATARRFDHSVRHIATLLDAKSAKDLMVAAAAFLTLVKGLEKFSRKELHDAMKEATGFYKKSDANNFPKTLNGLVKSGVLREGHDGNYALTASSLQELEKRIADAG